ncbi:unnamed protein product [Symbiodinium sp. CCMP2592]|nr:unnamed protein product [Symbiodinium sp. CCMP2592]
MKQLLWPRFSWAMIWTILSMAAAMKLGQESNTDAEATVHMHTADSEHLHGSAGEMQRKLLARSRSTSNERASAFVSSSDDSLDAAVSGKIFGSIVDTFEQLGSVLTDAGMEIGTAVGNSAMVIGKRVIEPPKLKFDEGLLGVVSSIGTAPLQLSDRTTDVISVTARQATQLARTTLEHAKKGVAQGEKIASKVGNLIVDKASVLGNPIDKVGPLAAGLLSDAWSEIKSSLSCFDIKLSLCHLLLERQCDCDAGSYVNITGDWMEVRCVFSRTSEFTKSLGVRATVDSDGDSNLLPGGEYEEAYSTWEDLKTSTEGLNAMQAEGPEGACETELKVAVDGKTQWSPDMTVYVEENGDTRIRISASVQGSYDTIVTGQGSCSYTLRRGIPEQPKTKVFCAGKFCVMISLQMIAELVGEGVLTGTIDMSNDVEFQISAEVFAKKNGEFTVSFSSNEVTHEEAAQIGASAEARLTLSVGPELVVWPMPGIPITLAPKFHAEAKAKGTIGVPASSLLQESESVSHPGNRPNASVELLESKTLTDKLKPCHAAAVSLYTDFTITGFGIPQWLKDWLKDDFLQSRIRDAIKEGAKAMLQMWPDDCVPGGEVKLKVEQAAIDAGHAIAALIPGLQINWDLKPILLLKPQIFFCKEVWTAPERPEFEKAPCAEDLGCRTAGQDPPDDSEVEAVPPEQVVTKSLESEDASSCPSGLKMGDRLIELGDFRIAEIDVNHLSLSHRDGRVGVVWKSDGEVWRGHLREGRTETTWAKYNSWGLNRPVGPGKGENIKFGYEFIQIGKFRLGAIANEDHSYFSVSHATTGKTAMVLDDEGTHMWGPRDDKDVMDRPDGVAAGISYGDKWIQIGDFRFGDANGNFAFLHTSNVTLEVYTSAGDFIEADDRGAIGASLLSLPPASWTCPSIGDIGHGKCSEDFGGWGDRFVQLGDWRLAAIDEDNFAFVHKNGENSEIFKSDGTRVQGRFSDRVWRRPLGFPYGITFGQNFIQIGSFRLAAFDWNHLSISHQSHQTPQTWRGHDASLWPKLNSIWNAWQGRDAITAGPPAGVGYGDRYLQLGRFRIGVADSTNNWLFVTHTDDGGDGRVIQAWKSDGTVHDGRRRRQWTHEMNHRITQWHCGNIQAKLGTCSGITTGPGFIQFGDWRMAAVDKYHFSISHRSRLSSVIFRGSDGTVHDGPFPHNPPSKNGWDNRESGYVPAGDLQEVKIGNRFIEFGKFWRVGEFNAMLSISHSSGQTPLVFQEDGTLVPGPSTDNNLFIRRGEPKGVTFGDRFVQIGNFRLGDVDGWHFSISHVENGALLDLYTGDGLRPGGDGREMYMTTVGRPLQSCKVLPEKPRLFSFDTLYALYHPVYKRYLSLSSAADMTSVAVSSGPSDLPYDRAHERFAVVDAGNGLFGLHNAKNNRFMMLEGVEMMASPLRAAAFGVKENWVSVKFEIVDAGDGMVGLYSPFHKRLAQMRSDGTVRATNGQIFDAQDLSQNPTWTGERFYMVPVKNYLQPATMVGLWNPTERRFLQMDGGVRMEGTGQLDANYLQDSHTWERFRVVDAGNGMVALHNYHWNRYVRMIWNGQQHAMTVSSVSPSTSVELPDGWADTVAFVPVPINTGSNEIALWHPGHSRAMQMQGHIVSPSGRCQAQDLNSGWAAATFRVVLLNDPTLI